MLFCFGHLWQIAKFHESGTWNHNSLVQNMTLGVWIDAVPSSKDVWSSKGTRICPVKSLVIIFPVRHMVPRSHLKMLSLNPGLNPKLKPDPINQMDLIPLCFYMLTDRDSHPESSHIWQATRSRWFQIKVLSEWNSDVKPSLVVLRCLKTNL